MELIKIESLLEDYFEGKTTLEEEANLREYFSGNEIAPHLEVYQPLFRGLQKAQEEVLTKEIELPGSSLRSNRWWYGIAAMLVLGLTVGGFLISQPKLTAEEQFALDEFNKARESMLLLSENLNKGTQDLALLGEFSKGTSKIQYINQFTNSTEKILK